LPQSRKADTYGSPSKIEAVGPKVLRSNNGSLMKKLGDRLGSFFAGYLPTFAGHLHMLS
jgi:hypothetical protein